jgi:hypothetical protein
MMLMPTMMFATLAAVGLGSERHLTAGAFCVLASPL